jgi:hypothetical protein
MTEAPPFAPPYRTFTKTETGVIVTETLADGSTQELSGVTSHSLETTESQISPIKQSPKKATPATTSKSGNNKAAMYLNVSFADKEQAKSKGARWDGTKKKWYVPHGIDINLFKSWWPDTLK